MHYEISHLPYERCWQNWVSAIVPHTLCFYTEFRFLPSSSLTSSSALIHFKWLLFLQVPSQFPDYSLLEVRDPVSHLGLGLEWKRYQMSVLCSAPWWTYSVLRDHPPHISRLGLSVVECLPLFSAWPDQGNAWPVSNDACKGVTDNLKASMQPPCMTVTHAMSFLALVFHSSRTGTKCKATHFLRIQKYLLICKSSAHPGQPSPALSSIKFTLVHG